MTITISCPCGQRFQAFACIAGVWLVVERSGGRVRW